MRDIDLDILYKSLAEQTSKALGITYKQALLRTKALHASKVLERFNDPSDSLFQYTADIAMRIPQIDTETN